MDVYFTGVLFSNWLLVFLLLFMSIGCWSLEYAEKFIILYIKDLKMERVVMGTPKLTCTYAFQALSRPSSVCSRVYKKDSH